MPKTRLFCALRNVSLRPRAFRLAVFRLLFALLGAAASQAQAQTTVNLNAGWNLLGNSSSTALNVPADFGNQANLITLWKWLPAKAAWAFYAPSLAGQALTDYAASKGYEVLSTIEGGEGFWVNIGTSVTAQMPLDTSLTSASFWSVNAGWNLIAIGDSKTPSEFNSALSTPPPASGVIPLNLITLWAWDSSLAQWYFYAPSLDAQQGSALADYIASKGYLDFAAAGKALGPGTGFWINKPDTASLPTGGDQYGAGPDPTPSPSGKPTSYNLIDAARTASVITEEQALIYKMYAEFSDPALPTQYRGDDAGLIEGDAQQQAVAYVSRVGLANIPATTLEALWPFFVPAYYEGSWWHRRAASASLASSSMTAYGAGSAATTASAATSPNCRPWAPNEICSVLTEWKNVSGTHVVIWYEAAREATDLFSANILLQEYENKIWPSLTALMGRTPLSDAGTGLVAAETDGRLDVMLVDMPGNSHGRTMTSSSACKAAPTHIYLSRSLPVKGLIAQAAHEFMHAIQYSYDSKSCVNEYYTTLEATAAWATNYVYPRNNWEQTYAQHYLKGSFVGVSYDDRTAPPLFRYGAYLLPLFLQTRFGPAIVKDIWDNTLVYSQELYAIDGALVGKGSSFAKEWPRFVAANWNRDTLDTYRKFDALTEMPDAESSSILSVAAGGVASIQQDVSLPHAASAYYKVGVGSGARSLMFVNGWSFKADTQDLAGFGDTVTYTGLSALERQGVSMQVYLKINGVWQSAPQNLANVPWLTACHDDPEGKVEEVVFMYANAEISPSAPNYTRLLARGALNPGLLATNIGCRDWTGSISMTRPLPGGQETLSVSNIVLKNAMPQASAVGQPGGEPAAYPLPVGSDNTISPGYGYVYSIASGDLVWTYNDRTSSCTYTGRQSFSVANPTPAHTLSNWTPPGAALHGAFLTGFVGMKMLELKYDWICPDSNPSTGTDVVGTGLDITTLINDSNVRISAGTGLSLSGTGAQSSDPASVTGTWSFQGAAN